MTRWVQSLCCQWVAWVWCSRGISTVICKKASDVYQSCRYECIRYAFPVCQRRVLISNCLNSKKQSIFLMMTFHRLLFSPAVAHLQRSHHLGIKKLTCITSRNEPNAILTEKISKSIFQKMSLLSICQGCLKRVICDQNLFP